jgi:chromosome segregation ATPase/CheY-like chemotaxis protein
MIQAPPPTEGATPGWRRAGFRIALIGPEAMRHRDLIDRAGYEVKGSSSGDGAQRVFAGDAPYDIIVLDFALEGRPPEAVLLFSRGSSSGAPIIAMVPAEHAESFRRAFMAGARDVLPSPARGEDLLASIDLLLEPRSLQAQIDRMRVQFGLDGETAALPAAPGLGVKEAALEVELVKLNKRLEDLAEEHRLELDAARHEAQEAERAREKVLEDRLKQSSRLDSTRKEMREGAAQLRLMERACEELQRKLKDARDQRRGVEARLQEARVRIEQLEGVVREQIAGEEERFVSPDEFTEISEPPAAMDPEEALAQREADSVRLEELERALEERARLAARVGELEEQLTQGHLAIGAPDEGDDATDPEAVLRARAEDEARLKELDDALAAKRELEERVGDLERSLSGERTARERLAELEALLQEREDRIQILEREGGDALSDRVNDLEQTLRETQDLLSAVRRDRDSLKRRMVDLERESADALTRVEELSPLTAEVERLRSELRSERDAHLLVRQNAGSLESRTSQMDRAAEQLSDELTARQRALVLAHARNEQLAAELSDARSALAESRDAQHAAVQQMHELEAELESLRITVAALATERQGQRGRGRAEAPGEPT